MEGDVEKFGYGYRDKAEPRTIEVFFGTTGIRALRNQMLKNQEDLKITGTRDTNGFYKLQTEIESDETGVWEAAFAYRKTLLEHGAQDLIVSISLPPSLVEHQSRL